MFSYLSPASLCFLFPSMLIPEEQMQTAVIMTIPPGNTTTTMGTRLINIPAVFVPMRLMTEPGGTAAPPLVLPVPQMPHLIP